MTERLRTSSPRVKWRYELFMTLLRERGYCDPNTAPERAVADCCRMIEGAPPSTLAMAFAQGLNMGELAQSMTAAWESLGRPMIDC